MAVKVTKSQICDGTISKNKCHQEYYLCIKLYAFMEKCTIFGFCHYTRCPILQPETGPSGRGSGCIPAELGSTEGLCQSTMVFNRQSLEPSMLPMVLVAPVWKGQIWYLMLLEDAMWKELSMLRHPYHVIQLLGNWNSSTLSGRAPYVPITKISYP